MTDFWSHFDKLYDENCYSCCGWYGEIWEKRKLASVEELIKIDFFFKQTAGAFMVFFCIIYLCDEELLNLQIWKSVEKHEKKHIVAQTVKNGANIFIVWSMRCNFQTKSVHSGILFSELKMDIAIYIQVRLVLRKKYKLACRQYYCQSIMQGLAWSRLTCRSNYRVNWQYQGWHTGYYTKVSIEAQCQLDHP